VFLFSEYILHCGVMVKVYVI